MQMKQLRNIAPKLLTPLTIIQLIKGGVRQNSLLLLLIQQMEN
jgi:hypothetical protein